MDAFIYMLVSGDCFIVLCYWFEYCTCVLISHFISSFFFFFLNNNNNNHLHHQHQHQHHINIICIIITHFQQLHNTASRWQHCPWYGYAQLTKQRLLSGSLCEYTCIDCAEGMKNVFTRLTVTFEVNYYYYYFGLDFNWISTICGGQVLHSTQMCPLQWACCNWRVRGCCDNIHTKNKPHAFILVCVDFPFKQKHLLQTSSSLFALSLALSKYDHTR